MTSNTEALSAVSQRLFFPRYLPQSGGASPLIFRPSASRATEATRLGPNVSAAPARKVPGFDSAPGHAPNASRSRCSVWAARQKCHGSAAPSNSAPEKSTSASVINLPTRRTCPGPDSPARSRAKSPSARIQHPPVRRKHRTSDVPANRAPNASRPRCSVRAAARRKHIRSCPIF